MIEEVAGTGQEEQRGSPLETEPIFVLDIGTRSVIGVVGRRKKELFEVLDMEVIEHSKRAMIDGQIEDIQETANVAGQVKRRLEERLGVGLRSVFVAAAGRALRTYQATGELELDPKATITQQQIHQLELVAIEAAYEKMAGEDGADNLYCVGHSVMGYHLDDYPISTLLGHRGKGAKVEILATFLPNEVVESLYSAMDRIHCTVASITLEPIAAMNAIIPKELRMLNLALVDIGAGTTDIAISNKGSVVAYTMATIAGDEITEAAVQGFLVDFQTAERMKRDLSNRLPNIEYADILGCRHSVTATELAQTLSGSVEALCQEIASRILKVNTKAPAAVFLVGGGSQMPGMCEGLARELDMDPTKIAVGGSNYMKRMISSEIDVAKPEFATPLGIAVTAMDSLEQGSVPIVVNGREVRLFKSGSMTVMDVLLMCGYKHSHLIGRSGKSVTFDLNSQKKVVRGEHATAASVLINGKTAGITTPVKAGDTIQLEPSLSGADAAPTVQDVAERWVTFDILLNSVPVTVGTTALVNGLPAGKSQQLNNLDTVNIYEVLSLADLCREAKLDLESFAFFVNGQPQTGGYLLRQGDDVRYFASQETDKGAREAPPAPLVQGSEPADPVKQGEALSITLNGKQVELYPKGDGTPYLFVDLLNFVDIDPSKPQGNIVLRINEREASYLDRISQGDRVEIRWETQAEAAP